MLFRSKDHIEKFRCYLYCQYNSILFLEIKIGRVNFSFSISACRKLRFSGVFTNFESFIAASYMSSLIFTFLFTAFKLCSNFEVFYQEILNLKDIFKRNSYRSNFIDVCIKRIVSRYL